MSIAYIETDLSGMPVNVNHYLAGSGFVERGYEVRCMSPNLITKENMVYGLNDISNEPTTVVSGNISTVRQLLANFERPIPKAIDYPESLTPFLGRKTWKTSLGQIRTEATETNPIFIKPDLESKLFTGHLVRSFRDLIKTSSFSDDFAVIASDPIRFVSEWRVFVLNGTILDVRLYKGDRFRACDKDTVCNMVSVFESSGEAPSAYAVDVGLAINQDESFATLLIEVNDGYSLGTYGLDASLYAQMIEARWRQLAN